MAFDLEVFNTQVYTTMTEVVDQQVNLFNAASGNTLVLQPAQNQGDFAIKASFKAISGLVRRRDVYNGSNTVSPVRLEHLKNASVKVASGTPPIVFEPAQYAWIQQNPELAALTIGTQLAEAQMQDMLNTSIAALVAAFKGNAAIQFDGTAATAKLQSLNKAAAKFGDRATSLRSWIVHSKAMHDIYDQALTNTEQLYSFGTVNIVQDAFGRRFVMTDAPALFLDAATDNYYTLGLVEMGAMCEPNGDFNAVLEIETGKENIQRIYQAEWSYNVGLKGYTWDTTNGGKAPSNTAIATSTNWDKTATSNKDTAGVLLTTL